MKTDGLYVTCIISGSQPLHVQIIQSLSVIQSQTLTNQTGTVEYGRLMTSDIYQCLVSNEYGSEQSSQFIEVPVETSTVIMTSMQSTSTVGPLSNLGSSTSILLTVLFSGESSLHTPTSLMVTSTSVSELTSKGSVESNIQPRPSSTVPAPSSSTIPAPSTPIPTKPQTSTNLPSIFNSLSLAETTQRASALSQEQPTFLSSVLAPENTQTNILLSSTASLGVPTISIVQSVETVLGTGFITPLTSTVKYAVGNTAVSVVHAASANTTTAFTTQVQVSSLIDNTSPRPIVTSVLMESAEATAIHSLSSSTRSATLSSHSPTPFLTQVLESHLINGTPSHPTMTSQLELSADQDHTTVADSRLLTVSVISSSPPPRPTLIQRSESALMTITLSSPIMTNTNQSELSVVTNFLSSAGPSPRPTPVPLDNATSLFSDHSLATQLIDSSVLTYSYVSMTMTSTLSTRGVDVSSLPSISTAFLQETQEPVKIESTDSDFPIAVVAGAVVGALLLLFLILLIVCICWKKKVSRKRSYVIAADPSSTATVIDLPPLEDKPSVSEQEPNGYSLVKNAEDSDNEVDDTFVDEEIDRYAVVGANPGTGVFQSEQHYAVPRSPPVPIETAAVPSVNHYQIPQSPPRPVESAGGANDSHFPFPNSESGYDRLSPKTQTESQDDILEPKNTFTAIEGADSAMQQNDSIPQTQLDNEKEAGPHYTAGSDVYAVPTKPQPRPRKKTPRLNEEMGNNPKVETAAGTNGNETSPQGLHYFAGDDVYAVAGKTLSLIHI